MVGVVCVGWLIVSAKRRSWGMQPRSQQQRGVFEKQNIFEKKDLKENNY